jgi:hypothetical protein
MAQGFFLSVPGLDALRQRSLGHPAICIAIIDSRVDLSHPALAGAQLQELMPAWLLSRMGPSGVSHGTHVASFQLHGNEHFRERNLALDSIYAEKSPLCRPKSDCWDVVMRFFDPANRLGQAVDEYRLTVDVNDISPVQIGVTRHWPRFA